jgi:hypothetical protein
VADKKQSTKADGSNTVEPKHIYYLPEYGISVVAASTEEAEAVAKKRIKQEQDK